MSYGDSLDTLDYIDYLEAKNKRLRDEITRLKARLTWQPVSVKPEKAGMYFVEGKPYTGSESTIIATAYFDGESFLWCAVVRWLPIPPAPEGEVK